MIKKFKLKIDPEENCFMCTKGYTAFDKESLKFILDLPLCRHHTDSVKIALGERPDNNGELIE